MKAPVVCFACTFLTVGTVSLSAGSDGKPRVFITESHALQLSSAVAPDGGKSGFSLTGGTSPANVEVIKAFSRHCPGAVVTANRDKADFVVRLDHEGINPTTPFVRGNKVAVFNKAEDLVYSSSTRVLSSAVKGACAAITAHSGSSSGTQKEPSGH